jgi:hypothetical protein
MTAKIAHALEQLIALQKEQNSKLDKMLAVLISTQLLTECIDYNGKPRDSEECAEITLEGYSAALCLMNELDQRNRDYQYQKQEFFVDNEEDDDNEISDLF